MKKSLTHNEALIARGLFALATQHYRKVREAEGELARLLDAEDNFYAGNVSDAIYDDSSFDGALKSEGITVKPAPKRR